MVESVRRDFVVFDLHLFVLSSFSLRIHGELPNQRQKPERKSLGIAGADVPGFKPFFAAREVGDQTARFENDETAGGDIPGLEC